jgi:hypothetical protein
MSLSRLSVRVRLCRLVGSDRRGSVIAVFARRAAVAGASSEELLREVSARQDETAASRVTVMSSN